MRFKNKMDAIRNANKALDKRTVNEHHDGDFPNKILSKSVESFLDELKSKDIESYDVVEDIIKKYFI